MKQKALFITFKGLSMTKKCLRPESAPVKLIVLLKALYFEKFMTADFKHGKRFFKCPP